MTSRTRHGLQQFYTQHSVLDNLCDVVADSKLGQINFIDFSAGDNFFAHGLRKRKLVVESLSYDIDPPAKKYGRVKQTDWFEIKRLSFSSDHNVMIGLNPPYGYRMEDAVKFIRHAMYFKPKYMCLLVPISVAKAWKQEYKVIKEQKMSNDIFYTVNGDFKYSTRFFILKRRAKTKEITSVISIQKTDLFQIMGQRATFEDLDSFDMIIRNMGRNAGRDLLYKTSKGWTMLRKGKIADQQKVLADFNTHRGEKYQFNSHSWTRVRMSGKCRSKIESIAQEFLRTLNDPETHEKTPPYVRIPYIHSTLAAACNVA